MIRATLACLLVLSLVAACDSGSPSPDAGVDAGAVGSGGGVSDGGADAGRDAGADAGSADASVDAGVLDAGSRAPCTFNRECPAAERCECDESQGCMCLTGTRGEGRSGVDRCDGGNDCASSLCVEGWGGYYCSGECVTGAQCGPELPVCAYISFVGDICVRDAGT